MKFDLEFGIYFYEFSHFAVYPQLGIIHFWHT